jgi:hypothetical protein
MPQQVYKLYSNEISLLPPLSFSFINKYKKKFFYIKFKFNI